ncbi:hypothetical protein lbkm_2646 [Lachnospiraceae bacterium KM106-2]|nr:hypothetical protein lbkm_2646 [Lachnospiraceae bacterium KM106-2]
MKRNVSKFILAASLTVGIAVGGQCLASDSALAQSVSFDGGNGTKSNPYQISSAKQLKLVSKNLKASYVLKRDINLKGTKWKSIGSVSMNDMKKGNTSKSFSGSFDGDGHTISNFACVEEKGEIAVGFFEHNSGIIKDVTFKNVTSKGSSNSMSVGAVTGIDAGTTKNVSLVGKNKITGTNCVGGIAGGSMGASISNCKVKGTTIQVTGSNSFLDGLIIQCDKAECGGLIAGGGFNGSVKNCKASGTVVANGKEAVGLGGIGGCLQCMKEIKGNEATVTIRTKNAHAVGGLCGYAGMGDDGTGKVQKPCKITDCKVNVKIETKKATHVGGLVGTGLYYYGMEDRFNISNCSVKGSINGAVTPGTVAGRATGSKIKSCKINVKIDGKKSKNKVGKTSQLYQSADQYEEGSKKAAAYLLKNVKGSYTALFEKLCLPKYDKEWSKNTALCVGNDKADAAAAMLKASVTGSLYGQQAIDAYSKDSASMAFACGFIQGVTKFKFNGNKISGTDSNGATVFSHTYDFIGYDKENGLYEFQTKDANAGEFKYFLLKSDTPDTTYHIEFRYGSDLHALTEYMQGAYAYWMAAGILDNANEQMIYNCIRLFCVENLSEQK